jgi:hypothetical protein
MVSRVSNGSGAAIKAALDGVKSGVKSLSADNTITLAKGDTLYGLAKKHLGDGSKWRELAQANNIKDPTKLAVGTKIAIPKTLKADQLEKGALTAQRKAVGGSNSAVAPSLDQAKPEGTVNIRDLQPVVIPGSSKGKAKLGETKPTQLSQKEASYTRENGQWTKNEAATKSKVEKSWKDNVSAEATIAKVGTKAEGSLAGAKAEHVGAQGDHIKNASAEIHAGYGSAEAEASAGLSWNKDGFKAGLGAKAGAEVSAVHAEASAKTQTYGYGAAGTSTSASAKGDLLAADAKLGAKAEISLKDGDANLSAEASAGAYLAKGEVKVKQHAAYIDSEGKEHNLGSLGVGAEGQVGIGASAEATVGMDDWKIKVKASAGLCVGVGGKVKGEVEIDLKGVYQAGKDGVKAASDAASYVGEKASEAASYVGSTYVGEKASEAASYVGKQASSTWNAVTSWW